ncbi:hypothetical protein PIB30_076384, partial [Stylosanthes scabra]|nr:hypothetical protein [Stylosanthes scabra]
MDETRANFRNQEAAIRNLEIQVGQIAKQLNERPPNTFPSDTIPNPKEECMAIPVIEMEETPEVQVEVPTEKPEIIAEMKNQEAVQHPPQSSKKHTRSSSKFLEVLACLEGSRRDKSTIEFDPEIEKTLKKNRCRVKAQRNLQFEQEE